MSRTEHRIIGKTLAGQVRLSVPNTGVFTGGAWFDTLVGCATCPTAAASDAAVEKLYYERLREPLRLALLTW